MVSIIDEVRASLRILRQFDGASRHAEMPKKEANRLKCAIEAADFPSQDMAAMFDLLGRATFVDDDRGSLIDALANEDTVTTRNARRIKRNAINNIEIATRF